ncbi:hypothetical protein [Paenisporosarcina sp. NPDC076898]|uniref:hypothetical protein n=1 Tax=unclassified Paenisporosarcina TaxID=2642018 RepID=UPI003CFE044C
MNKNHMNSDSYIQNTSISENNSAKLALIASVITTFGDALATVAAALALEEAANSNTQDFQNQNSQDKQLIQMQKQIDYLTNQVAKLNKSRNKN